MKSAEIKRLLKTITQVPTSYWSRWSKYKIGSPTDMNPPQDSCERFMKGLGFGGKYPHLIGDYVRLYGGPMDGPVIAVAVITRDDNVIDILNISGTDNMIAPTGDSAGWTTIWPDGASGAEAFVP